MKGVKSRPPETRTYNALAYGTVRRSRKGFAHAILLYQGEKNAWQVIDLWGPTDTVTDADVVDWPIVYTPEEEWGTG